MSVLQIPTYILKKEQHSKSQSKNFLYELYECVYLLRVKKFSNNHEDQNLVDIVMSTFYEGSQRCLLVLVCSNGSLLLHLREGLQRPITKQLNWFQNPSKKIVALCIDPLRGSWVLCACFDSSLYLIPALAQLKDSTTLANAQHTWSQTDLSRIPFSKTLKGRVTSVIWWHTLDDRNVGIIATENGELIFLDISQHQEIDRTAVGDKIVKLELLQDINNRTTELFIFTAKNLTLQLLLEQPSQTTDILGSSSFRQGYDLGYDMVTDCNVDSILVASNVNKEEIQTSNRLEVLQQEFQYTIHNLNENVLIGKFDAKYHTLEIFSDIKRVPEYVYYIPQNPSQLLLCKDLMFTVTDSGQADTLNILSRQLSTSSYGRQGSKRQDSSRQIVIQTFNMISGEQVLSCYKSPFLRQPQWTELFPHKDGYKEECDLCSFLIVTKDGLLECRPCISPEHYFTELAIKHGTDVAEKIGFTLDLNVSLLYEFVADKLIAEKDVQNAVKFYNLSKCSPIKRSSQLVEFSSVTDGLIYIKQVLKKPPSSLPAKDRKRLSNMAILCYVEQILNKQRGESFSKTLADSFSSFIYDNFDYDEQLAMDLLVSHGMIDSLFEVAKTRGKIEDALEKLSLCGLFLLPQSVQNMLLDRGYADVLCKASNGIFLKHMQPEEVVKFMLSQPNITVSFISTLTKLLLKFEETSLLQIARVFDPSRQFIKPILDKLDKRKRSGSGLSLISLASNISIDDPSSPTPSDIIVMFLKTIITLNSKRTLNELPDLKLISRHLSGQCSWSGSIFMRSDSVSSTELMMSEMSRIKIACGRHHIAYVTGETELYTWGRASSGRLGHGDLVEERATSQPMRVESLQMHGIQVLSVSCGALHTIVLCHEGVFAWGSNKYGQLGIGDKRKRTRPVILSELSSKQIHSIVCGQFHSIALTNDYNVYSWGWGVHGQLGLGSNENQLTPQPITLLHGHRVIQVAAGYGHSAVLTSRGQIFTFGAGLYGQLGIGVNTKRTTPQLVESLTNDMIYLIACGSFETLAVADDQTIFCWGRNYHQFHICGKAESASYGRQMASNTSDISHRYLPEDLPFKLQQTITQLVCGNWHYMALTSANIVYTWGCNDCGQLGHYNKIDQSAPRLVKALSRKRIVGIAAGCEFSVAVDDENQVLAWGRADGGLIGIDSESLPISPVARRSTFSVLVPTIVPGLPIHFDQVSIDSNHGYKREFLFDETYELPDLSSVGRDKAPYNYEAVLLSLYKLAGLYNTEILVQFAYQVEEWFILSFCHELQEKWDKAFTYRAKAVLDYYVGSNDNIDFKSYAHNMLMVVADLLNKFEDHLTEEFKEDCSFVTMVSALKKILDFWFKEKFSVQSLEDLLRQHMEPLCPLYAIVFFGFLGKVDRLKSSSLRFALYKVTEQHILYQQFSNSFLNDLLSQMITHMDNGSNWYTFLSDSTTVLSVGDERNTSVPVGESTLSRDQMLKEIIEHKQTILNTKPFISLSNAVAATLAAASTAHRVESSMADPLGLHIKEDLTVTEQQPDSVVFSCAHNLPRYYMLETVIPELESRMAELPVTLANTAKVLAEFYKQFEFRIPLACPYCVYNNLRNEQLRVLRESGNDFINDRSSLWEI